MIEAIVELLELEWGSPRLGAAVLAACRLAGLVFVAPFLPAGVLSIRLKLAVVGALSLCVVLSEPVHRTLALSGDAPSVLARPGLQGWLLVFSEILLGAALGWMVLLVLGAVRGSCRLISEQVGISTAAVVDPLRGAEDDVLARFYSSLAVLVLLSAGLHLTLVETLVESFSWIPPGSLEPADVPRLVWRLALENGVDVVGAALTLALPAILAMLFVSLAQGILGRMLPEAELLVLGLPLRVLIGLGVLAASVPASAAFCRFLLESAVRDGREILRTLGG
ncbi:MAG: flagellar biosynthetic protein FliR [Planctomycetota bacterium]|nr:flagellar biosynthetic protein FliR [Planctomycetota bacterium]